MDRLEMQEAWGGGLRGGEGEEGISAVTAASSWADCKALQGPRTKTCN